MADAYPEPSTSTILFDIGSGTQTIAPSSALPQITHAVVIDGTSQTGFSGSPLIVLNGTKAGSETNGLDITASGCAIKSLVINGFGGNGVVIEGGTASNVVAGDYIGTDFGGTQAVPNMNSGVLIDNGATDNTVGGTTAAGGTSSRGTRVTASTSPTRGQWAI